MYCLSAFCCVCLNDGVKLQDINHLDTDGLPLINKIIFVSFGHEAIDFKVVRYICLECTSILQSAYTFKRSCLVNHELLRIYSSQLRYFTGKPSEYQDLVVSLEKLSEKNEDEQVPEIVEDKENEIVTEIRVVPVKILSPNKKKINDVKIKCNACDAVFNRYALLQMHYNTKHKTLFKVVKKKLSSKKGTISYTCNICTNKLASLFSLTRHLQLHALKKIPCKYCDVHVENNESYKRHLTTAHANRSTLRCDMCDLTLENDFHFRRHMFLKHTPRKCKHCNEIFFNNSELWAHNADNHRVHKCNVCEKAFTLLKNLRTHMKTHESPISNLLEDEAPELITVYPVIEMPVEKQPEKSKIDKNEQIPHQTVLLNSRLRKKCTNCLSVFGSGISLKKHKCFKLNKNMFQCDNCLIIYSKKSSFINHVKNCTLQSNLTENIANTPELQESEQMEIETDTISQENDENVVKKENDLEIKEEILDDFICNAQSKEKETFEIGNVYSMSEFPENQDVSSPVIDAVPSAATKANDNTMNTNVRQPKKTFPKIKLIEKNTPKCGPDGYAELLNALRLRCKDISVLVDESTDVTKKKKVDEEIAPNEDNRTNKEISTNKQINTNKQTNTNKEIDSSEKIVASVKTAAIKSNPMPEISSTSDIKIDKFQRFNLRRKTDIVETTETIFANTEFSDSNESAAKSGDNPDIVDPLFGFDEAAKSNCTSRSASVSRDCFNDVNPPAENVETVNVQTKTVGTKKDSISKRRKSIWNEQELNENLDDLDEIINAENVASSNIGSESSIVGTEPLIVRTEPSIVGTEPLIVGTESSVIGAKSSIVQEESSIVGTESLITREESSNIREESSNIGVESSNIGVDSSNIREESSNIGEESSNIGTESSDIETIESSNTESTEAKKHVITKHRRNISSEDTSNENSNDSLFEKTVKGDTTKGTSRKRRKSIWLDDIIELTDSFNFDDLTTQNKESTNTGPTITENTETVPVNKETIKRSVKRRRKSVWMEDTSNENSRESSIEKTENTKEIGFKTTENTETIPVNEEATKKTVKKRRKSVWMEVTSNENSSESFIEKIDNIEEVGRTTTENTDTIESSILVNEEASKKSVKNRRKSVWMEDTSNENSRESFIEKTNNTEGIGSKTTENTETIVSSKPVNKKTTKTMVKIRRQSVWMENTSNENSNESLIEKADNTEKVGPSKSKKRRKSVWAESTSNENSNESSIDKLDNLEQTEPKKTSIKGRRKSIWMELNEELSVKNIVSTEKDASATAISVERSSQENADLVKKPPETNKKDVVKMRRKSVYIEGIPNDVDSLSTDNENEMGSDLRSHADKTDIIENKKIPDNENLEPIILKTRRSIKQSTKSRRRTIHVYHQKTEAQENQIKSSDVNKNVADVNKLTVNSISSPKSPDFLTSSGCSSIQTFKLRSLRRKSICEVEQGPKVVDDSNIEKKQVPENDTNYITVRKVSDINNDISGQQK